MKNMVLLYLFLLLSIALAGCTENSKDECFVKGEVLMVHVHTPSINCNPDAQCAQPAPQKIISLEVSSSNCLDRGVQEFVAYDSCNDIERKKLIEGKIFELSSGQIAISSCKAMKKNMLFS